MAHCLRHHTRGSASSEYLLSALLVGLMGVAGFTAYGTGMGKGIAGDGAQGAGQARANGGTMALSNQAAEEGDSTSGSGSTPTPSGGSLTATRTPLYIPETAAAAAGAAGEATAETSGAGEGGTRSAGDLANQDAEMFPEPKGEGTPGFGSLAKRLFMLTPIPWLHATLTGNEEKKKEYGEMLGSFGTEIRNFPVLMGDLAGMVSTWMRHGDWGAMGKMASLFAPQTFAKMIAHDYKSLVRGDMTQAGRGGLYTLINFQWFGGAQLTGELFRGAKVVGETGQLTRGLPGTWQAVAKLKNTRGYMALERTRIFEAASESAAKARVGVRGLAPDALTERLNALKHGAVEAGWKSAPSSSFALSSMWNGRKIRRAGWRLQMVDTGRLEAAEEAYRAARTSASEAGLGAEEVAKRQEVLQAALENLAQENTRYTNAQSSAQVGMDAAEAKLNAAAARYEPIYQKAAQERAAKEAERAAAKAAKDAAKAEKKAARAAE